MRHHVCVFAAIYPDLRNIEDMDSSGARVLTEAVGSGVFCQHQYTFVANKIIQADGWM